MEYLVKCYLYVTALLSYHWNLFFEDILETSIYPNVWKLANVTPIFKKDDKQLVKNYQPISLLPICGKLFEKLIFTSLYSYLNLLLYIIHL